MIGDLIDQRFDAWVDRLVIRIPETFRMLGIRIAHNPLGWHLWLIMTSIRNVIGGLLVHFRSERDMDLFMNDTAEQLEGGFNSFQAFLGRQMSLLIAIDEAGIHLRFYSLLFYIAMVTCGCIFSDNTCEMAALAACIMMSWISTSFEIGYEPMLLPVRQVYVTAKLISAFSYLPLIILYYTQYLQRGVSNNMMLQGMMIFMLLTHIVLFLIMIVPNRKQSLVLRILSGILGFFPSLMVACSVAFSATQMGTGLSGLLTGLARILGACFLFLGDRLEALYSLGSLRLPLSAFLLWFNYFFGLLGLLLAAWG